ncbi:MAG: hypothetical protein PHC53_03200 [Patescibacteria group bacterium]|nr:hypothetical protein [Patescibacteria group bacterium]
MLGYQLRLILDSFKQGVLKLSSRKLNKPDAKLCDRLMNEQRALNERAARMLDVYERKMEKIAALLEECRQGNIERLAPHIRQLQMDLKNALMRAELAGTETSDLERELADWQYRWRNGSEEPSPRYKSLLLELRSRGSLSSSGELDETRGPIPDASEEKPVYFDLQTLDKEPDEEEMVGTVIYSNQGATGLETDPEQLVLQIKNLSRELARYKQDPISEPAESLRMARQIRQLHAILRQIDRKSGDYRDRIGLTDGFEHVFSSH